MAASFAESMQGHQYTQGHQSMQTASTNVARLAAAAAAAGWISPRNSISPRVGGRAVSSEPLRRCPQPPTSSAQRSQHSASPRHRMTALLEKSLKQQQSLNQVQNLEQKQAMSNALLQVFASTDEAFAAFDTSHRGCLTSFQWAKGLLDYSIDIEQAVGVDAKQAFALLDPFHKGHVTRFGWRSFFELAPSPRSIADIAFSQMGPSIALPQGPKPLGGIAPRLRNLNLQRRCTDGEASSEVTSPILSPSLSSRLGSWAACARHTLPPAHPGAKKQERKSVTSAEVANLCQEVIANCGSLDAAFDAFDVNDNGKITRVLFDSALAALKVNPEKSLGVKSTRLFALMSFGEGHINRASWDRFWQENGVDLNMTVDVPEDKVVRRKAWKAAVKLTSTTCSGILQRRNELSNANVESATDDSPLRSNDGCSTQTVGPEQEVLESILGNGKVNYKTFSNCPDGSLNLHELSDDSVLKFNAEMGGVDLVAGTEGTIHLPSPPSSTLEGDDSLMARRRMSLRRFLGRELSGDSSCKSGNNYLNEVPSFLSADGDVTGSKESNFTKGVYCQQDPLSPTYASTRSPSTATDRSMCSSSTIAPDDASEYDLQSMPSTPLLGQRSGMKIFSSCPQMFQQDIREELSSLADGECRTYGAGMTTEQLTILQRELKIRGIEFEITGEGATLRIEVKSSASSQSAQDTSSVALRSRSSCKDGSGASASTMLPSIGSPKFPLEDSDQLAALGSVAFATYASSTGLHNGAVKVFRKADLGGLVQKLRKSDNSDWPRRRKFIKSACSLERLFDEALQLQIDMKGQSSAGLTVEFFKVYIQMCSAKLGWSASSLLFALVDDLDCIHRERLGCA